MRNRVAGMIVGAALMAAACSGSDDSVADHATPTTTIADTATTSAPSPSSTTPPATEPDEIASLGLAPLEGLLQTIDIGNLIQIAEPGSAAWQFERNTELTADDGSRLSEVADAMFGPAFTNAPLVGSGPLGGAFDGVVFYTDEPADVVETFLSDERWPRPEPIDVGDWTVWDLGDDLDLARRDPIRTTGAGGQLIVAKPDSNAAGWVLFTVNFSTSGDALTDLAGDEPRFAAAAPLMTNEWQAATFIDEVQDAAFRVSECSTCDEATLNRFLDAYGPTRTIRQHEGMVILSTPEAVRLLIFHEDPAHAETTLELLPRALANQYEIVDPFFSTILRLSDIRNKGSLVIVDFDLLDPQANTVLPFLVNTAFHDSTELWGPD